MDLGVRDLVEAAVLKISYGPSDVPCASAGTSTGTPAMTTKADPRTSKIPQCPRDNPLAGSDESP